MTTTVLRIIIVIVIAAASAVLCPAERAFGQVVFAPYGAHRGRIVIRPWVQKIWWGNGLTPYGAATIQHTVTAAENVITNENVQDTLSNLISRELDRREARSRSMDDCGKTLSDAQSNREALERLLGSTGERKVSSRDVEKKETTSRDVEEGETPKPGNVMSAEDTQKYADYYRQVAEISKGVQTLAEQTQSAIDDGEAFRARIKVIQDEVDKADKSVEELNQRLRELLDGLAPLKKKK